jgi:glycosyltransferase involved in cell wall biosynthesis
MRRIVISVVVPTYGCNDCIRELVSGITENIPNKEDFEILLVDDASVDGSWETIKSVAKDNEKVRGIRLSRNVGQHLAILVGLKSSIGDQVVVMDCDLQDPPYLIPQLLDKLKNVPVVIAMRQGQHQTFVRSLQNEMFAVLFKMLTGKKYQSKATSYSAINRQVVNEYIKFTEIGQHYLYVLGWLGFKQEYIEYTRPFRPYGRSSYDLARRIRHAANGMLFESTRFLRLAMAFGLLVAMCGFLSTAIVILGAIQNSALSGWPSTISILLTFSGLSISLQAIVGMYVARTFEQSKLRPLYVISETI